MSKLFIVSECLHADDPAEPKELARFTTAKAADSFAASQPTSTTIDHYQGGEWIGSTSRLRRAYVGS